jgi:protein-disulfide isomerase
MNRLVFVFAFILGLSSAAYADSGETDEGSEYKNEFTEIKSELVEIKKELKSLRALIQSNAARGKKKIPSFAKTGVKGDPSLGRADAPVVLVEFSDYQCPYCARHSLNTIPRIKKEYIDTGTVRYVFKDMPLAFHKNAGKAAEAAHCAGEKGKYWEMHDLLFKNQKKLSVDDLRGYGASLGLKKAAFKKCLDDGRYAEDVKSDLKVAQAAGIKGTPSFIVGKMQKDGMVAGRVIRGAQPYEAFKAAIDEMLEKKTNK